MAATGHSRHRDQKHRDRAREPQTREIRSQVSKCHQGSPCQVDDSPNSPGWGSTPVQPQAGCRTRRRSVPGEFLIILAFVSSLHAVWPMGGRRPFFFIFPQVNGKKIREAVCKNDQSGARTTRPEQVPHPLITSTRRSRGPDHSGYRQTRKNHSDQYDSNAYRGAAEGRSATGRARVETLCWARHSAKSAPRTRGGLFLS
jgi:hypothetical protein